MQAVVDGTEFGLRARITGEVIETVDAAALMDKIAVAAWECADPGIQYDDTINAWHTNPTTGRITASNPCSEYLSLDNSSCNLASLNLMKFLRADNMFDALLFQRSVEIIITAMEISISFADFPTEAIGETTRNFRQLGIGFANLGALLMATGLAYDSAEGRAMAAAITSLMTGTAYKRSAEVAGAVGPYAGYAVNAEGHKAVMDKHHDASENLLLRLSKGHHGEFVASGIVAEHAEAWQIAALAERQWTLNAKIGEVNGWRNAQASVLAPTGTIGFMMDCDTTGVEPDFTLIKFKKMVGGASMEIVNQQVPRALRTLGYTEGEIIEITNFIAVNREVVGAPVLKAEHYAVFDCAAGEQRSISAMGHVRMMAACQPFLSGAISKTVNLPETATVAEIRDVYMQGWTFGLKALAVYRDNCKVGQPLSSSKKDSNVTPAAGTVSAEPIIEYRSVREKLPRSRKAETVSFRVGEAEGYMTTGTYPDGRLGEVFLKMSKQGSTLAGVMDAFSVSLSIALQYGVPLETFVSKYTNQRFEPYGMTDDPDIRLGQSIIDYIFRRLALDYLPFDVRSAYGIFTTAERTATVNSGAYEQGAPAQDEVAPEPTSKQRIAAQPVAVAADVLAARAKATIADAPECSVCHTNRFQKRSGACWACSECGSSTGCS